MILQVLRNLPARDEILYGGSHPIRLLVSKPGHAIFCNIIILDEQKLTESFAF